MRELPPLPPEVLEQLRQWCPDERGSLRYWLETGLPDGFELEDYYPADLIEEVKKEIQNEA